jgi:hypothetical protein
VSELAAELTLSPGGAAALRASGTALGGGFTGTVRAGLADPGKYTGRLQLREVDLAGLPEDLLAAPWLGKAVVSGRFDLAGRRLESLEVRGGGSVAGRIDADQPWVLGGDYAWDGRLTDLAHPARLGLHGTGRLTGWKVHNTRTAVVEKLRCTVLAFGRSVDVGGLRARLLGGPTHGLVRVDFPAGKPTVLRGRLTGRDLRLSSAALVLGDEAEGVEGTMDLVYRFRADGLAPEAVVGRGILVVRDSRMTGVPLVRGLLDEIRAEPESASNTDVDLAFDHAGPVVTLTGGRMATPLAAISPVPGGTVNLRTHQLDLHVFAALLGDLEGLVDVPILELVAPLARRLTRLQVTGRWDSREAIQIRKESVEDVGEGLAEFFRGAARTGGQFGDVLLRPLRDILR